jgi:two-component system invasion response regulator UvrY
MIRVLVVDDHAVVRQGIRQILQEDERMEVVADAQNGAEALEYLLYNKVDVAIMDISMPGMSSLEAIRHMHHDYPRVAILVLSVHPEDQYAIRSMRTGAAGYLTKSSAPEELVTAIDRVARGYRYISQSLAERLALDLQEGVTRPLYEHLSDREYEVFRRLATGQTVQQIAGDLMLSPKTVSTYRTRMMKKMRMKTSGELMRYAVSHGLVE